jgi:hypothetical protein
MNLRRLLQRRRNEKGSFFNLKGGYKYDYEIKRKYGNLQQEKTSVH